eukprot:5951308-Alexandrium_andersonii.AAC.1
MRSGLWSADCCGLGLRMAKRGARRKLDMDGGGMGRRSNDELQINACGYRLNADGGLRRNPNSGLMGSPYRLLIVCGRTRIALGCCLRIADCGGLRFAACALLNKCRWWRAVESRLQKAERGARRNQLADDISGLWRNREC